MAGVLRVSVVLAHISKPLVKASVPTVTQACSISGRILREQHNIQKPKPYPYREKNYTFWNAIFDKTSKRFDENSKLIAVEGPIASGKANFAKELAKELDMLYLPQPSMEDIYINKYGFDFRTLDDQLPEGAKSFDNRKFCLNPFHRLSGSYQLHMYSIRVFRYIEALAHILSTGQGVVCNRTPYSDSVFLEAMLKNGYVSRGVRSVYYQTREHTLPELMKPHLVIYLDVPVEKVKENIKKRNVDYEINSPALTDQYLKDIETEYKHRYLKDITTHSELLVYDWTEAGEPEVVVEDIERIDFDRFGHYDKKMEDWRIMTEWEWCEQRMLYTSDKYDIYSYFNIPRWDVPELLLSADDSEALDKIYEEAPGNEYATGYNASLGDKNLLWRVKEKPEIF